MLAFHLTELFTVHKLLAQLSSKGLDVYQCDESVTVVDSGNQLWLRLALSWMHAL
jgi:hypothetical protein